MSDSKAKLTKLLNEDPQLAVLLMEILGSPLGLRETRILGDMEDES